MQNKLTMISALVAASFSASVMAASYEAPSAPLPVAQPKAADKTPSVATPKAVVPATAIPVAAPKPVEQKVLPAVPKVNKVEAVKPINKSMPVNTDPIVVGVTCPFTGEMASLGVSMRDGVRLAVAEINQSGGIYGHKIKLVERDDESDKEKSVAIAKKFVESDNAMAVVGFCETETAKASMDVLQKAKIPTMIAVATGSDLTKQYAVAPNKDNYIFKTSMSDAQQINVMASEAARLAGPSGKVAFFHDSTNAAVQAKTTFVKLLKDRGLNIVAAEQIQIKGNEIIGSLGLAHKMGATVLVAFGSADHLSVLSNNAEQMKWKVPLVTNISSSMITYIDKAKGNAVGTRMPQTIFQNTVLENQKSFVKTFRSVFKYDRIPSVTAAAQGYDAMHLLASAIKQSHSTDGKKIVDAMESLKDPVDGILKSYKSPYSQTNHEAITDDMISIGEVRGGLVIQAH